MSDANTSETRKVTVVCPTCRKQADIQVPTYVFAKNATGIVKVQVRRGHVCEHHFVVSIDQHFAARGFEAIDYALDSGPERGGATRPEEVAAELGLKDVVTKFGSFATILLLRAYVFGHPVLMVVNPTDAPNAVEILDHFFTRMIPPGSRKKNSATGVPRGEAGHLRYKRAQHLVLNTDGVVLNSPWGEKKKKFTFERQVLQEALSFDDPDEQAAAVERRVRDFFERGEFVANLLEKNKRVFIKDLQKALQDAFGGKFTNYDVELLEMLLQRRHPAGKKLVKRIRRWEDNLAEILSGGRDPKA